MRIDAHQHYWVPERGDYGWLDNAPAHLRRSLLPADLAPLLRSAKVDATVLVQAAPTVAETDFLLAIAETTPCVAGVVGWIDFSDPDQYVTLERLAANPLVVGLRPDLQDLATDWILRPEVAWALRAMAERGLTFDALGRPLHARSLLKLCERHPDLRVVLDHGLKPAIAAEAFEPWASDMRALATNTTAFCKLSGLVTEAPEDCSIDHLRPWFQVLLEAFGPTRLVWGSDWPVLNLRRDYAWWVDACEELLSELPDADRAAIFGGNALEVYRGLRTDRR